MSKKPNMNTPRPSSENLDDEIREAMRLEGWLVPETVEDVLKAEREFESNQIPLPAELLDVAAVLRNVERPLKLVRSVPHAINDNVMENLARAARNGSPLSAEIEEQMRQDRARAERKHDK